MQSTLGGSHQGSSGERRQRRPGVPYLILLRYPREAPGRRPRYLRLVLLWYPWEEPKRPWETLRRRPKYLRLVLLRYPWETLERPWGTLERPWETLERPWETLRRCPKYHLLVMGRPSGGGIKPLRWVDSPRGVGQRPGLP